MTDSHETEELARLRAESERKLAAVRVATTHSFPTADIEVMLAEIAGTR